MASIMSVSLLCIAMPTSNAAIQGDRCSKLNSKTTDDASGSRLDCKKNKSGKLVWTKSKSTSVTYNLNITVKKINSLSAWDPQGRPGDQQCIEGGRAFTDIAQGTKVEVRDGQNNLISVGQLKYTGGELTAPGNGNCYFKATIKLQKFSFYQVKISTRFNESYSFQDLTDNGWTIELSI